MCPPQACRQVLAPFSACMQITNCYYLPKFGEIKGERNGKDSRCRRRQEYVALRIATDSHFFCLPPTTTPPARPNLSLLLLNWEISFKTRSYIYYMFFLILSDPKTLNISLSRQKSKTSQLYTALLQAPSPALLHTESMFTPVRKMHFFISSSPSSNTRGVQDLRGLAPKVRMHVIN